MATATGGKPILILAEGTQRFVGRDARRINITAARVIAETVRTTLGPRGMDKMLVESGGDITVTNDGATILKTIEVKHPAAKILVELSKTQETEVGDGTTSVVVLAGELLKYAEDLLDKNIHPAIIMKGYKAAMEKSLELLKNYAKEVKVEDKETLIKIAETALNSKASGITAKDKIAKLAVEAVEYVAEKLNGKYKVNKASIKIQKQAGGETIDSELIQGIAIDKEVAHPLMPKVVKNAKIAVLGFELKIKKTEYTAKLTITSPDKLKAFMEQEDKELQEKVERLIKAGANVVICQKDIDDMALHYLAKNNVLAVKSVDEKDIKIIAKATGAKILKSPRDISSEDLGYAELVEERKYGDKRYVVISGCKNPRAVTILARGGSEHIVSETERSLDDAISVIKDIYEEPYILPGGGATEIELAKELRKYARTVGGKEQLAIEAFANALEIIPKTLAENSGMDVVDTLLKLRSEHEKGNRYHGIDLFTKKIEDMFKVGIIEPLKVKKHVITGATETAIMILRIDDLIAAKGLFEEKKEEKEKKPEETPPTPEF